METPKNHGNLPQTVVFVPNMIRCYLYIRELTWADSLSSYLSADRTEGFTEESHRRIYRRITQKDLQKNHTEGFKNCEGCQRPDYL